MKKTTLLLLILALSFASFSMCNGDEDETSDIQGTENSRSSDNDDDTNGEDENNDNDKSSSTEETQTKSDVMDALKNYDREIKVEGTESRQYSQYSEKEPLVMYHESKEKFDEFRMEYLGGAHLNRKFIEDEFEETFKNNVVLTVFMGEKNSGGYNIFIKNKAVVKDNVLYLGAELVFPPVNAMVSMSITSPNVFVIVPKDKFEGVKSVIVYDAETSKIMDSIDIEM